MYNGMQTDHGDYNKDPGMAPGDYDRVASDAPGVSDSAAASAAYFRLHVEAPSSGGVVVYNGIRTDYGDYMPYHMDMHGEYERFAGDAPAAGDVVRMNDVRIVKADAPRHSDGVSARTSEPVPAVPQEDPAAVPPPSPPAVVVVPPDRGQPAVQPPPGAFYTPPSLGGGGGGGGGVSRTAVPPVAGSAHGGGSLLPAITGASWNLCGSNNDLYIEVRQGRPMAYVMVGMGGAEPLPATLSSASEYGLDTEWHAQADPRGGNVTAEARVPSGPAPAHSGSPLPPVECLQDGVSHSPCYIVADAKSFGVDRCSGRVTFSEVSAVKAAPAGAAGNSTAVQATPAPVAAARPEPEPEPEPEPDGHDAGVSQAVPPPPLPLAPAAQPTAAEHVAFEVNGRLPDAVDTAVPGGSSGQTAPDTGLLALMAAAVAAAIAAAVAYRAVRRRGKARGRPLGHASGRQNAGGGTSIKGG